MPRVTSSFLSRAALPWAGGELPSPGCSHFLSLPGFSQIASGQERTFESQCPAFLWGCLGLIWGPASGEGAGSSLVGGPGWEGNSPRNCGGLGGGVGLSGRAGGSGLGNTSWFCTPLTPNQLARAWHLNPSHSLLIPRVTDHQTFFLACSTKVHQLGVLRSRPQQLYCAAPLAWLPSVPTLVGFILLHAASAAQREEMI